MRRGRCIRSPLLAAVLLAAGCASSPPFVEHADGRVAMGTALELKVWSRDPEVARAIFDGVFAEVEELERLLSHYDPGSEVSRLAATAGEGPQPVDSRLADITRRSLEYGRLTGGAFDVTLGPLTSLWKEKRREGASYEEVARVRARTGLSKLVVHADGRVELKERDMSLDFGGIAKGYALDAVLPRLQRAGAPAVLAIFGQSSIWAVGAPPGSEGWELALRSPAGGLGAIVTLSDQALSVSSSFPDPTDGEATFANVVDPRTGWPLTHSSMVAVVSNNATRAEAMSTALLLMQHEKGLRLIEDQPETEALIVDDQGRIAESSGWRELSRFREIGSGFRGLIPR